MKRFLSFVLAIIILTVGTGLCDSIALADWGSAYELDTSYKDNTTYYSGQWEYKINKSGYAAIVGYTDKAASFLYVPHMIDGLFVSSLSNDAFADLHNLESIVIPTEVATFGSNLFADRNVTICAWNGSLALAYASSNGLGRTNLSELDFQPDVVDLSGASTESYYIADGALVAEGTLACGLTEGKPFFIPGADKAGLDITTGIISSQSIISDYQVSLAYSEARRSDMIRSFTVSSSDPGVMIEVVSVGEGVEYYGEIGQAKEYNTSGHASTDSLSNDIWTFPLKVGDLEIDCDLALDFNFL